MIQGFVALSCLLLVASIPWLRKMMRTHSTSSQNLALAPKLTFWTPMSATETRTYPPSGRITPQRGIGLMTNSRGLDLGTLMLKSQVLESGGARVAIWAEPAAVIPAGHGIVRIHSGAVLRKTCSLGLSNTMSCWTVSYLDSKFQTVQNSKTLNSECE